MFQRRWASACFLVVATWGSLCAATTLDFEGIPLGTRYGQDYGNTPGEVVYTSPGGIRMSIENFFFSSQSYTGFARGEVGGGGLESYFPTRPLLLDNISVAFDVTQVGFDVDRVTLEYLELGGLNNFSVNGRPIIEVTPLSDLPTVIAPGILLQHELLDSLTGRSRITLTGDVDSVLIGGQELAMNLVTAVPEPATWALLGLAAVPVVWRRIRYARR